MTEQDRTPKLEMRMITKRFGTVEALRGANLTAWPGEIHALLGENGAGKTTLMNILSGVYRADAGEIWIDGRRAPIVSPRDGLRYGIGMVHQHVEMVPHLSALENILLGREGSPWWLRLDRHRAGVEDLAQGVGLDVDLAAPAQTLSVGAQQKVEILKVLYRGSRILILDEPTTFLIPQEVEELFATVRALATRGLTVLFITHKMREVLAHCDRITIMRGGQIIRTVDRASADPDTVVEMMMGERSSSDAGSVPSASPSTKLPPVLVVGDLTVNRQSDGGPAVSGCTLTVAPGELVGIAGVAGNGQRELAEAIVGILPVASGSVEMAGHDLTRATIRDRIGQGVLYIPEDRIADGILPTQSVADNLALGLHPFLLGSRFFAQPARRRARARQLISEYGIATADENAPAGNLSGGNLQKLLVSRVMTLAGLTAGKLLIAMNPSRGLDVQATAFIHHRLRTFCRDGGGVLLVSADLDELMDLCDQILVMYRGRIVGRLPRAEFDPLRIGHLMAGSPVGSVR